MSQYRPPLEEQAAAQIRDALARLRVLEHRTIRAHPDNTLYPRVATIDLEYNPAELGLPRITLDGSSVLHPRQMPYLSGYTPAPGDRVYVTPLGEDYLIIGPAVGLNSPPPPLPSEPEPDPDPPPTPDPDPGNPNPDPDPGNPDPPDPPNPDPEEPDPGPGNPDPDPDPDPPPPPPPPPPSFWLSGVARPGGQAQYTQQSVDEWGTWRGRQTTSGLTYSQRTGGWDQLVGPTYVVNNWTRTNFVPLIGQPLGPNLIGSAANGAQANAINSGAYDSQWRRWGDTLNAFVARGMPEPVTNLAFEFNGNWFPWSSVNPTAFIQAYRRIVSLTRETRPTAEFAWTVNAGASQTSGGDARNSWPGPAYVNYIGIDLYDHYPQAIGYAAVNTRESTNVGRAKFWETFALAQGKKIVLCEWGLNNAVNKQAFGGHDNPGFIQWVYEWLQHLKSINLVHAESYFNDVDPNNVWSDLLGSRNPQSSLKYRELWRVPT
ncbi:glycosyl hydrolase [Parafrankia discariae]|uniref:glycosyl hydrolase n=1 Tax=Parafrankia discariae TaxID=365528 RepID=UPI0012B69AF1|nr:glycosyl hydrolase [Parafrankia discariae]